MVYEFLIVFIGVVNVRSVLFLPVLPTDEAKTLCVTAMKRLLSTNLLAVTSHVSRMTFNNVLCITYHP